MTAMGSDYSRMYIFFIVAQIAQVAQMQAILFNYIRWETKAVWAAIKK